MTHDLTRCQSCGAGRNLGKTCIHCGAPYPPPGSLTYNDTSTHQSAPFSNRIQIDEAEDGGIIVKISNRSLGNWIVLAFMAFWCIVIVNVFWFNIIVAVITLPLLAFGAFFLYRFALTDLLNRAVIRIDQSSLSLYHSPLPVPWKKSIKPPIANIEQIYVSREHQSTKDSVRTNPVLNLITKAGERIELHRGTSEHLVEEFVSVRKALLRSLKIPVEPIAGEAEDVRWSVNQDIDTPAACYCCGVSVNPGAFCRHCGSAYPQASVDSMTAPVVSLSARSSVKKLQDGIAITWRWGTVGSRNLLWFAIAWNIIVLTISSGAARVADAQFHVTLLLFLLIGAGLAVVALTMHHNVTEIRASSCGVHIKDRPVPMPRRRHFALNEIDAVAATMQSKLDKKKVLRFPVLGITTRDGQKHCVVKGFQEAEFGDFELMAREIRSVLGRT